MVRNFDDGKDFITEMDFLKAIRWGISAWENDVSQATITICWGHFQCYDFDQYPRVDIIIVDTEDSWAGVDVEEDIREMQIALEGLRKRGAIEEVGNLRDFINPVNERILDDSDDLVDSIATAYNPELHLECGDDEPQRPPISDKEAFYYLQQLQQYEEQQETLSSEGLRLLRNLRSYEREVAKCQFESSAIKQTDIRSFWGKGKEKETLAEST